ncbi:DUF2493 domain-containing protein [Paraburkholderia sp.]|uniref:DUF2493 domain-containing protein n=1 Tax=Paraburkholderia sp. TaxID=1926495 RepID=UPI0039E577C9
MRLLVCGGRDFTDQIFTNWALDAIHARRPVTLLIEGGARGGDRCARNWAIARGILYVTYEADWDRYRYRAGPIRNQKMLDEGRPELVTALPGGKGTTDMVLKAHAAGVPVKTLWKLYDLYMRSRTKVENRACETPTAVAHCE